MHGDYVCIDSCGTWPEDDEFLSAVVPGAPHSHRMVATILRAIIAEECGLKPHQIAHSAKTDTLLELMVPSMAYFSVYNYDYIHVASMLLRCFSIATGGQRPDFVRFEALRYLGTPPGAKPKFPPETFGEWIRGCMYNVEEENQLREKR
jgi:hypothetical protein